MPYALHLADIIHPLLIKHTRAIAKLVPPLTTNRTDDQLTVCALTDLIPNPNLTSI